MALSSAPYSVLMSVYGKDVPDFFDASMQSMVDQTVPFAELVLVCDGPLSAELDRRIDAWAEKLGGRLVTLRLETNQGLGNALQVGLEHCSNDIVARMDSDDISRSMRCELLLKAMAEGELDLVGGAISEFGEKPGDLNSIRRLPSESAEIRRFSKKRNPFNHVSVMFKKEAVLAAGGYKPFYLMEDYYLWVRMLSRGCRCRNIDDVVVDVRVGSGMYGRRSGIRYLRSQKDFFGYLRNEGYISRIDYVKTMAARAIVSALPADSVKAIYGAFLRNRGKQQAKREQKGTRGISHE